MAGTTPLSPDKVPIAVGAAGSQTIARPLGNPPGVNKLSFIRVLSIHLTASATTIVTHVGSNSNQTVCTDYLGTGNSMNATDETGGVFDLPPGDDWVINNSAGNLGGCARYIVMGG